MNDEVDKLRFEKAVSLGIVLPDSLRKAIQELTSGMHFSTRELKSEKPYVRFIAMTKALEAVESFMERIPQFKRAQLHLPFRDLRRCLFLLKDGIELPEFTSMRSPKSETSQTERFKRQCAEAMELLMSTGCKRLEAAKIVSKYWPEKMLKPNTIADWRDNLIGNSASPSAKNFRQRMEGLKALNLPKDVIEDFHKVTTTDQRGVNLKRQTNRVIRKKERLIG
jgi:hypothetical protein